MYKNGVYQTENLRVENGKGYVLLTAYAVEFLQDTTSSENVAVKETNESVTVPFRMLSETLIKGYWIDFSAKKGLLKNAVGKFDKVTIYPDHDPSVEKWLGVTTNARYTNSKGIKGIDADFVIDKVSNPKIARGLTTNPPAIKACSVGINFAADKSHEMSDETFYSNIGKEVDGEIVRLKVSDILSINEVSLVYAGADPNATKLSQSYVQTHGNASLKEKITVKLKKSDLLMLGLDPAKFGFGENETEKEIPMEQLKSLFDSALNKLTIVESKHQLEIHSLNEKFKVVCDTLGIKADGILADELTKVKSMLEIPKKILELKRSEALKAYKAVAKEKANPVIEKTISESSLEQAEAFAEQYRESLESMYPIGPDGKRQSSKEPSLETADKKTKINTSDYI